MDFMTGFAAGVIVMGLLVLVYWMSVPPTPRSGQRGTPPDRECTCPEAYKMGLPPDLREMFHYIGGAAGPACPQAKE